MKGADVREALLYGAIAGMIGLFAPFSFLAFGILCAVGFRKGAASLTVSSALYFVFSLLVLVFINRSLTDTLLGISQFGMIFPGILLIIKKNSAIRTCVKLFLYSLIWFMVLGGIYAILVFNPVLHDGLVEQLGIYLKEIIGSGIFNQGPAQFFGTSSMEEFVRAGIFNVVNLSGAMIFLTLSFVYWSGQFLEGILDGGPRRFSVRKFTVHESVVWVLIVSLGFLTLSNMVGLEKWLFPVWNIVMVLGLLYGLQGVGIILHLLDQVKTPILLRGLALAVIIVVLGLNMTNYVVLGFIPLFGLTENWIKYRKWKRRGSNENYSE